MKRDMELVRDLLLYFEAKPDPKIVMPDEVVIPGWDQQEVWDAPISGTSRRVSVSG